MPGIVPVSCPKMMLAIWVPCRDASWPVACGSREALAGASNAPRRLGCEVSTGPSSTATQTRRSPRVSAQMCSIASHKSLAFVTAVPTVSYWALSATRFAPRQYPQYGESKRHPQPVQEGQHFDAPPGHEHCTWPSGQGGGAKQDDGRTGEVTTRSNSLTLCSNLHSRTSGVVASESDITDPDWVGRRISEPPVGGCNALRSALLIGIMRAIRGRCKTLSRRVEP
jgi:hypothetical protein